MPAPSERIEDELPADDDSSHARRLFLQEFLVDFLGGLVPGILFLVMVAGVFLPALHTVTVLLANLGSSASGVPTLYESTLEALERTENTPSAIWICLFVLFVLLAYVVGHVFYRHDLKRADRASFERLKGQSQNDNADSLKSNFGCETKEECEFPYPYYHLYLKQRGLDHLEELASWTRKPSHRSKTYINILKVRLKYYFPHKCATLIKNEAHVRLAASTWYVSTILEILALWSFLAIVLILAIHVAACWFFTGESLLSLGWRFPELVCPALVWFASRYCKRAIEGFLHYQRLREIFFVLETAFTAFRGKKRTKLLNPPFSHDEQDRG